MRRQAVFVEALVSVDEHGVPVGVNEIRRAEGADLRGEASDDLAPLLERRHRAAKPGGAQQLEQRAERVFGVGLPHRMKATQAPARAQGFQVKVAVVGEYVYPAAQFALERLAV